MSPRSRGYPVLRWGGMAMLAATWGQFALGFAVIITGGAILLPLCGLLILGPFVLINYLVWSSCNAPLKPGS